MFHLSVAKAQIPFVKMNRRYPFGYEGSFKEPASPTYDEIARREMNKTTPVNFDRRWEEQETLKLILLGYVIMLMK